MDLDAHQLLGLDEPVMVGSRQGDVRSGKIEFDEVASHLHGRLSAFIAARRDAADAGERDRADRIQLRLAILASVVVAPSLVTGFYGANLMLRPGETWPGGFWLLLGLAVLMFAVTLVAVVWIARASGRERARLETEHDPSG